MAHTCWSIPRYTRTQTHTCTGSKSITDRQGKQAEGTSVSAHQSFPSASCQHGFKVECCTSRSFPAKNCRLPGPEGSWCSFACLCLRLPSSVSKKALFPGRFPFQHTVLFLAECHAPSATFWVERNVHLTGVAMCPPEKTGILPTNLPRRFLIVEEGPSRFERVPGPARAARFGLRYQFRTGLQKPRYLLKFWCAHT